MNANLQKRHGQVSPARVAAYEILLRVERDSAYASELLHSEILERIDPSDQSLATELVMGVLRWRSAVDSLISGASAQKLSKLDLEVLLSLRLGVYQLHWLSRIPERAAIHESVELVKRAHKRSAAPFVNAVLRKLTSNKGESKQTWTQRVDLLSAPELAERTANPRWLIERWAAHYGLDVANKICWHNQAVPETSLRLRSPDAEDELRSERIEVLPGVLLATARRVVRGNASRTRAFRAGLFTIQDEASQLVAALVGYGSRVLDCCAAPGGKTLAIADRNAGAELTAMDIHPHRTRLLKRLVSDSALAARLRVVTADARNAPLAGNFDRVLADVPCSGTGTLARNPEIKWRLKPEDLFDLQKRQISILRAAMEQLAPGGRLVYSTCSLEAEENEDVVTQALREMAPFRLVQCDRELERLSSEGTLTWKDVPSLTRGPYLRTLPGLQPCDGFFAAILERA